MLDFLSYAENLLNENCSHRFVALGDFNINTIENNIIAQNYTNLFESFSLQNVVNLPTYIPPNSSDGSGTSCLDHIWHNLSFISRCYVLSPSLSDHNPVVVVFENITIKNSKIQLKLRDFNLQKENLFLEI